ncbi:unnamed protein product [Caenorhabditis brenneri]
MKFKSISIFIFFINLCYGGQGPLTVEENQLRLETCGKFDPNVFPRPWLWSTRYRSKAFFIGIFISSRHFLTSSRILFHDGQPKSNGSPEKCPGRHYNVSRSSIFNLVNPNWKPSLTLFKNTRNFYFPMFCSHEVKTSTPYFYSTGEQKSGDVLDGGRVLEQEINGKLTVIGIKTRRGSPSNNGNLFYRMDWLEDSLCELVGICKKGDVTVTEHVTTEPSSSTQNPPTMSPTTSSSTETSGTSESTESPKTTTPPESPVPIPTHEVPLASPGPRTMPPEYIDHGDYDMIFDSLYEFPEFREIEETPYEKKGCYRSFELVLVVLFLILEVLENFDTDNAPMILEFEEEQKSPSPCLGAADSMHSEIVWTFDQKYLSRSTTPFTSPNSFFYSAEITNGRILEKIIGEKVTVLGINTRRKILGSGCLMDWLEKSFCDLVGVCKEGAVRFEPPSSTESPTTSGSMETSGTPESSDPHGAMTLEPSTVTVGDDLDPTTAGTPETSVNPITSENPGTGTSPEVASTVALPAVPHRRTMPPEYEDHGDYDMIFDSLYEFPEFREIEETPYEKKGCRKGFELVLIVLFMIFAV